MIKPTLNADTVADLTEEKYLLYWAWTIIANVSEGCWDKQTEDWVTAAKTWRDRWHATLPGTQSDGSESEAEAKWRSLPPDERRRRAQRHIDGTLRHD